MAPPVKSSVWTFFIRNDSGGECKLCKQNVKTKGNTTNLKNHLERHHQNTYSDLNKGGESAALSESEIMPKGVKIFLLAHNATTSGEEIRFTRLRSRPGLGSSNLKFPESLCDQTNGVGVTVCDVAPAKIKIIDQHHVKVSRTGDLSQAAEFTVTEFCYNGILYKV